MSSEKNIDDEIRKLRRIKELETQIALEEQSALSIAGNAAAGVNEAVESLLTFIPNTMKAGAQVLSGRGEEPFEPVSPTIFGNAASTVQARTPAERAARSGGKLAGETGLSIATGGAAFAPRATSVIAKSSLMSEGGIGSAIKSSIDDLFNQFRGGAIAPIAGEVGTGFAAGVGGGVAQEVAPDSHGARIVGEVSGGLAPSLVVRTPVSYGIKGVSKLNSKFSRQAQANQARKDLSRLLGGDVSGTRAGKIEEGKVLERVVPGLDLTLAEKTESPALISAQRKLESSASGAEFERNTLRHRNNIIAVENFSKEAAPSIQVSPDFIIDDIDDVISVEKSYLQNLLDKNTASQEQIANGVKRINRVEKGSEIRDRFSSLREATSNDMTKLSKDLKISDIDVTQQVSRLSNNILEELASESRLSDKTVPSSISDLFSNVRTAKQAQKALEKTKGLSAKQRSALEKKAKFSFSDLKSFRERLGREIRDSMKNPETKSDTLRKLVLAKSKVDDVLDGLSGDPDFPQDLVEQYSAFIDIYRAEFVDRFESGTAFKLRQKGIGDFYKTSDEKVADVFFSPKNITAARQFKATFKDDAAAYEALEASIVDKMAESTVKDGVVNKEAYDTWMRKHDTVLDEFPGIKEKLKNIGTANEEILSRRSDLLARQKFLQTRALTRRIESLEKGVGSAENILEASITNPKMADQILSRLKDNEQALTGYKRWVWDKAASINSKDMETFIFNNESFLENVLGKQHLDNIKKIQRAKSKVELIPEFQGTGAGDRPDIIKEKLGTGVPQLGSRIFAVQSGRTSSRFVATELAGRYLNKQREREFNALFKRALYDEDFAELLTKEFNGADLPEPIKRKLNFYLYQTGMPPIEDQKQEKQE